MKSLTKLLVAIAMVLSLAPSVYADGTLQYGTCDTPETQKILDTSGSPVAVDSLVQLWDTNTNQIIDTTTIGFGIVTDRAGRFVDNVSLPSGNYSLKIRVYNTASPDGSPSTCAVVVGETGIGTAGIAIMMPDTGTLSICFPGAQIPDQNYVSGEGGCSAPSAVQLQSFSATSTSIATEPVLLMSLAVLILSGGWAVGWVVLPHLWKAKLNLNGRK